MSGQERAAAALAHALEGCRRIVRRGGRVRLVLTRRSAPEGGTVPLFGSLGGPTGDVVAVVPTLEELTHPDGRLERRRSFRIVAKFDPAAVIAAVEGQRFTPA